MKWTTSNTIFLPKITSANAARAILKTSSLLDTEQPVVPQAFIPSALPPALPVKPVTVPSLPEEEPDRDTEPQNKQVNLTMENERIFVIWDQIFDLHLVALPRNSHAVPEQNITIQFFTESLNTIKAFHLMNIENYEWQKVVDQVLNNIRKEAENITANRSKAREQSDNHDQVPLTKWTSPKKKAIPLALDVEPQITPTTTSPELDRKIHSFTSQQGAGILKTKTAIVSTSNGASKNNRTTKITSWDVWQNPISISRYYHSNHGQSAPHIGLQSNRPANRSFDKRIYFRSSRLEQNIDTGALTMATEIQIHIKNLTWRTTSLTGPMQFMCWILTIIVNEANTLDM